MEGDQNFEMAPQYKLTYFNVTGLGEPIRYLLAYGKLDFEDKRVEFAEFETLKPNTPFGKLPYLEVDGKILNQSAAICRHVAKKTGLVGKSDWDATEADSIVDTITDLRLNYTAFFREKDETKKAVLLDEIKTTHNPYYFSRLETIAKGNGGYFVNQQLTWADVFFASIAEMLINITKEPLLDDYPTLKAIKEKVENLPGIKEYRANRPETVL